MAWKAARVATAFAAATRANPSGASLSTRIGAIPRMVWAVIRRQPQAGPALPVLAAIAGILYVMSPLDLIPELLLGPVLGVGDDIAIAVLSFGYLLRRADAYLSYQGPEAHGATQVIQGTVLASSSQEKGPISNQHGGDNHI